MPQIISTDDREHRIPGRNSSGKFKPGVSGNPNGRPPKSEAERVQPRQGGSGKKSPFIAFEAQEGTDVLTSMELNATRFVNAAWEAIGNGNQRLSEIAFAQLLKDRGQVDPLAGLKDLMGQSPEELRRLAAAFREGEVGG